MVLKFWKNISSAIC